MGRKLTVNVRIPGRPGNDQGPVLLMAGEEVPDWARDEVGEHCYSDAVASPEPGEAATVPPRGGAGSGVEAWQAYAAANDVDVEGLDKRDDIVEALEKAGVPVEADK